MKKPAGAALRREAGGAARTRKATWTPERDAPGLLHELKVHEVELQMQNEELRRIQLELEESRDRYHELYDLAPVAYLTLDHSGRVIEANASAARLFGADRARLMGRPLSAFLSAADAVALHRYRDRILAGKPVEACNVDIRARGGRVVPVRIDATASSSHHGEPACRCVLVDLSELRQYQKKLQEMAFDATLAQQRERRRIARDLHDRIGQSLAVAHMKVAALRGKTRGATRQSLDVVMDVLRQAMTETRTLTFDLSPPILYDLGLPAALGWLADQVRELHGTDVEVQADPVPELSDEVAALLFRFVQELLMNVIKHARTRRAKVGLQVVEGQVEVEVADRGVGFDVGKVWSARQTGFGLFSVREQTSRLGGTFAMQSAPRKGTVVRITVPLARNVRARGA